MNKKLDLDNLLDLALKSQTLIQINMNLSEELDAATEKYEKNKSTSDNELLRQTKRINGVIRDVNYIIDGMLLEIEESINEASQSGD